MKFVKKALGLFSFLFSALSVFNLALADLPKWSYDAGPNLKSKMGKELIDITAAIPNMPEISMQVMGSQKFRPAFGPIPWRMLQEPNKTKILFIGQDGTHIAEASGRPATAGFGGRAQDLAAYFGVDEGAAFINTYAFTIKGQYGAFQHPFAYDNGEFWEGRLTSFVDNPLWVMTHDLDSPIAKWRNNLIDWILRNNQESMKLIVTFGGSARDAIGTFVKEKGGDVKARSFYPMDRIQIPETRLQYAGGNNQFPALVNEYGKDLYEEVLGKDIDYTSTKNQEAVMQSFADDIESYLETGIFTQGGPHQNGLIEPAQMGGYDLDKIMINGSVTRSLKGLTLSNGKKIKNNVLVVSLPHPSYLSRQSKEQASALVGRDLKAIQKYVDKGWEIEADPGKVNTFAKGKPYRYSRSDIGPEYYDFGTPGTRMLPVSLASRMRGNAHVIIFGTRDRVKFDMQKIDEMTFAKPATNFSDDELFTARPRTKELRYIFDAGPGEKYAKLIKENLDLKKVFKKKAGMDFKTDGIAAYNVKNHPEVADFGHYRGTFKNPKVLIIADPDGYDDLISSRALTGTRGQYLQGLMEDMGVKDQYLVIKTVPFGMDGATQDEWNVVLEQTSEYREKLLSKIMEETDVDFILTDGRYATRVAKALLDEYDVPRITLRRKGDNKSYGIKSAGARIAELSGYKGKKAYAQMKDIPRSHLSFYARLWEGTSGDRVLNASDKYAGLAFAEVAPKWAWAQKTELSISGQKGSNILLDRLEENGLPSGAEKLVDFLERWDIQPGLWELEEEDFEKVVIPFEFDQAS